MPYPTKYTRQYDFQSYQVSNPTRPLPGDKVNTDLNAVKQSVAEIIDFLKGVIRSDGRLMNGSVGVNQLDATFKIGFSLPATWEPTSEYTTDSTVFYANRFYQANVAHTSTGGFDESKWNLIVDFGAEADAAATSAAAALISQNAAAVSALATAADRVQTGQDAAATAADRVQTGLDAEATAADRVQTGQDVTAANSAKVGSEAARDTATAAASALVTATGTAMAASVADADALVLDVVPGGIQTAFFGSDQLSGSAVEFTHSGLVNPSDPGQIDITAAGVTHFYIRSNRVHRPEQHGVKSGGDATTNRLGLIEMFNLANRTGNEIDMGRNGDVYDIDDTITHEFTRDSVIRGTGAKIRLASSGVKLFALRFLTNAEKVDHEGFHVDANAKAPNALWYENYAASYVDANVKPIKLVGVGGSNGKRILLADYFGAGITVRGAWDHALMRDCYCEGMVAAAGANDASNGIMGFYVGRDSNGLYPVAKEIYNPTIGPIRSEDPNMAFNMDGIHIADVFPASNADRRQASTYINGGSFKNPWGRAIKVQGQSIEIVSPMIWVNDGPLVGGVKKSTCFVSLQYAEGTVRGLRAFCEGASTISAVDGTARTYANGKMSVIGTQISGRGSIPNIDQIAYRYSEATHPRGSLEVSGTGVSGVFVDRFASFYSRLNGTENIVMKDNWAEAVQSSACLVGNDSGSNVVYLAAYNNFQASSTRPLVATTTATVTSSAAGNIGFS